MPLPLHTIYLLFPLISYGLFLDSSEKTVKTCIDCTAAAEKPVRLVKADLEGKQR